MVYVERTVEAQGEPEEGQNCLVGCVVAGRQDVVQTGVHNKERRVWSEFLAVDKLLL